MVDLSSVYLRKSDHPSVGCTTTNGKSVFMDDDLGYNDRDHVV